MATPVFFVQSVRGARAKSRRKTTRATRRHLIGVLDINTYALIRPVLDHINQAQTGFHFAHVTTTLPTGLGLIGERVLKIAKKKGFEASASNLKDLEHNIFFEDFVPFLDQSQEKLELGAIAALVAPMIAFIDEDDMFQNNLFSVSYDGAVMVSAFDLRAYAKKAKRPFEACMTALMAAQVWAGLFDDVDYHRDVRGCLYDFCIKRDDIVKGLAKMRISDEALALFPEEERSDVRKVVAALAGYKR